MKNILYLLLFVCLGARFVASEAMVGCYAPTWADISATINPSLCTHVYFAFAQVDGSGRIWDDTGKLAGEFAALKKANSNLKLLVSIGGWGLSSGFPSLAKSPTATANFIKNCVDIIKSNNLDGVDIDWEFPADTDKASFVNLLCALKKEMAANGKLLTIATSAIPISAYNIPGVCNCIDFNNVMTYDGQTDTRLSYHAGLSFCKTSINAWVNGGCPKNKIVLGIPLYGKKFNVGASKSFTVGSPSTSSWPVAFNEFCSERWPETYDKDEATVTAHIDGYWLNYDNVDSMAAKTAYAISEGLVGVFSWASNHEDITNKCGLGRFPLMTAIARGMGLKVNSTFIPQTTRAPTQAPTTAGSAATQASSGGTAEWPVCTAENNGKNYIYPGDCNKFLKCNGNKTETMNCQPNLVYNEKMDWCDYKSQVPRCA